MDCQQACRLPRANCLLCPFIEYPLSWVVYHYKSTKKWYSLGEKRTFLSYGTGKLSHLFHHDLLEINVSCNFGSTKNRCNRAPTGNLSCSTLADKDEFSILMNHLNALREEICSSVSTFVRLWCCKTCNLVLKYLSFLFLFVLKTLGGKLGGEFSVLSPRVQKTAYTRLITPTDM